MKSNLIEKKIRNRITINNVLIHKVTMMNSIENWIYKFQTFFLWSLHKLRIQINHRNNMNSMSITYKITDVQYLIKMNGKKKFFNKHFWKAQHQYHWWWKNMTLFMFWCMEICIHMSSIRCIRNSLVSFNQRIQWIKRRKKLSIFPFPGFAIVK